MKKNLLPFSLFLLIPFFSICQVLDINVVTDTPSCNGICCGELEVSGSGSNPPFSYMWSTGDPSSGIYNIPPGNYTVTVTDFVGMTALKTFTVEDLDVSHVAIEVIPQSCFDEEDAVLKDSVISGLPPFFYRIYDSQDVLVSIFGPTNDTVHVFDNLKGGELYRIVTNDKRTCFTQEFITTTEKPPFLTSLGEDVNIMLGQTFQLEPVFNANPISIQWTPTDGLSCTDCLNPSVTPLESICYSLEATDENGCVATDTICIEVGTTSMNETKTISFEIFPTPVENILNIKGDFDEHVKIEIIDSVGKKINFEKRYFGENLFQINVDQLSNGVYFLEIRDKEKIGVQKFLKL